MDVGPDNPYTQPSLFYPHQPPALVTVFTPEQVERMVVALEKIAELIEVLVEDA